MAEQRGGSAGPMSGRFFVGVAVPLALVVLAYFLWQVSDRLLYIGPLDRAAFEWSVVIPIWIGAPVAAGSVVGVALVFAAILVASFVLLGPICNRPPT